MKLTLLLILINVLIFLFTLQNFDFIIRNYGFSVSSFLSGRYYVVITSMFIHGGISHILFNMIALFFLGYPLEQCVHKWQYLLAYFLAGIVGNLLLIGLVNLPFLGYTVDTIAIGASAAIAGLVGFGTFICPTKLVLFEFIPLPFIAAGALFLVLNISGFLMPSNIAYPAHIGGMFVGAAFGLVWGQNRKRNIFLFISVTIVIVLATYLLGMFL